MTAALLEHVATYAAQVRAHLADLSPEQVDDLTDGLEADLAEALHDSEGKAITGEVPAVGPDLRATRPLPGRGAAPSTTALMDLTARFGSPKDYAEELRSAAGLPTPALAEGKRDHSLSDAVRGRVRDFRERLDRSPSWPALRRFLQAMRPLWWVVRGWMAYSFIAYFAAGGALQAIPASFFQWLLFLALVVASLFYGQQRWAVTGRARTIMVVVEIICIWMVIPTLASADSMFHGRYAGASSEVSYVYGDAPMVDGVYVGGQPVSNLFVYDANGDFIDHAQIVDSQGQPVRIDGPDRNGPIGSVGSADRVLTPLNDSYGRQVWNAFPLFATPWTESMEWDGNAWVLPASTVPQVPAPPLERLAPLDLTGAQAPASGGGSEPGADPTDETSETPGSPTEPSSEGAEEPDPAATSQAPVSEPAEGSGGATR